MSQGSTFGLSMSLQIYEECCCNCGVTFWMTCGMQKKFKDDKSTFYCPNGHGQSYRQSTAEKKFDLQKAELENRLKNAENLLTTRTMELHTKLTSKEKKIRKLEYQLKKKKE